MKRAVLDTNILISSIFWEFGNPHKVVELALNNKIKVFASIEILRELEKILKRDFGEPEDMIEAQIALVLGYSEIIKPAIRVSIVKEDPEDDKILECALACDADFIITGDRHLLRLGDFQGIKIVTAKQFLSLMGA